MPRVFPIETNIPMPVRTELPPLPLDEMEVGDSFLLEYDLESELHSARQRLTRFQQSNPPRRFSMRKVDEYHVRIFRIADFASE